MPEYPSRDEFVRAVLREVEPAVRRIVQEEVERHAMAAVKRTAEYLGVPHA